jgi:presenilin-like A22 family membrane protease
MKHALPVTLLLVLLFVASQVVGLAVIREYITGTTPEGVPVFAEPTIAGMRLERPDVQPSTTTLLLAAAIAVGTLLILLLLRSPGGLFFWKLWFFLAIAITLNISFGAFLPDTPALILALVLAVLKTFRFSVILHNLSEIFVYSGLAVIFVPLLNIQWAIIILLLISAYDMYAVWKSKHMIRMAQFQARAGMFAGLLIPYGHKPHPLPLPVAPARRQARISKAVRLAHRDVRTAVLGGGDMSFPLIFAGVVMKEGFGFLNALYIAAGATAALALLLWLGKKGRFYPAMPFLTAGCLAGFIIMSLVGLL